MVISFPALPLELLHNVALFISPRDIMALTATCVSLRNSFNDNIVFKQAFIDNVPPVYSRSIDSSQALADRITQQLNNHGHDSKSSHVDQQLLVWKCLALSSMRIPCIGDQLDSLIGRISAPSLIELATNEAGLSKHKDSLRNILELLNISVVWGCESVCNDTTTNLMGKLSSQIYMVERLYSYVSGLEMELSFSFSVCCLQQTGRYISDLGGSATHRAQYELTNYSLHDYPLRERYQPVRRFPQDLALLMIALVALSCKGPLSSAKWAPPRPDEIEFLSPGPSRSPSPSPSPTLDSNRPQVAEPIPLPGTWLKSFSQQDTYNSPFATSTWNLWYDARCKSIMNTIDECEWQGCYTYGFNHKSRVDPLMRHIRFRKVGQENHDVKIEAVDCSDKVGSFRLDGTLYLDTCSFLLTKTYFGAHSFGWKGAITPLGLAGFYYNPYRPERARGAFWLWKSEWKDD